MTDKENAKVDVENLLDETDVLDGMKEESLDDLQFFIDDYQTFRVRSGYGNFGGEILSKHPIVEYLYSTTTGEAFLQCLQELFMHYEIEEIVIKQNGDVFIHD